MVSGIGFLGAGTILAAQGSRKILGLTTAASIWAVAAVGLAAGAGLYFMAALTAFFILVTLTVLRRIDLSLSARTRPPLAELRLTVHAAQFSADHLRAFLRGRGVRVRAFSTEPLSGGRSCLSLLIEEDGEDEGEPLAMDLMGLPGVEQASVGPGQE